MIFNYGTIAQPLHKSNAFRHEKLNKCDLPTGGITASNPVPPALLLEPY